MSLLQDYSICGWIYEAASIKKYSKFNFSTLFLSGDSYHPNTQNIMTVFRNVASGLTEQEREFNRKVRACRTVTSRTGRALKTRFKRLQMLPSNSLEENCYVITSACFIHNLTILYRDELIDESWMHHTWHCSSQDGKLGLYLKRRCFLHKAKEMSFT